MSQIIIIERVAALAEQIEQTYLHHGSMKIKQAILACLHPIEVPDDAEELAKEAIDKIGRTMLALGEETETSRGPMQPPEIQEERAIPYLAALIDAHAKRVPRAMLSRIVSYTAGMMDWNGEVDDDLFIDEIAKEFGYRAE